MMIGMLCEESSNASATADATMSCVALAATITGRAIPGLAGRCIAISGIALSGK